MRKLILILLVISIISASRAIQTDSLIEQSLNLFDLDMYQGKLETPKIRLGHYSTEIVLDSNSRLALKYKIKNVYRIWHILPHTSIDEAGILIGDTLIYLDGMPIYDSLSRGDDFLEYYTQTKREGDIIKISVLRNDSLIEVPVKLIAIKTSELTFTDPGIGEVKKDSWLKKQIDEFQLNEKIDAIKKQMAEVSISDYNKIPFSKNPNPWRLNAVTYLHRYPMRVGAYSRYIVNDLWDAYNNSETNGGFPNVISRIAKYDGIEPKIITSNNKPGNINELNTYFASVQSELDKAYHPVKDSIGYVVNELLKLLQSDDNYELDLERAKDEIERKRIRNEYEKKLANVFRNANSVDLNSIIAGLIKLSALIDKSWLIDFISKLPLKEFEKNYYVIPGVEGEVLYFWVDGNKKYIIGGKGTNKYTGNFNLIIDVGGDDIYEPEQVKYGSFRFIADMQGNDTYISKNGQGSGMGCIDVLFDVEGDDTYRGNYYSQGAGLLGAGILADFSGDDLYISHWCSQGAACLGIGLLFDVSGNDNYFADVYSQGFGYIKGIGLIMEYEGNDSYKAGWKIPDSRDPKRAHLSMSQGFGFGMRPWSLGLGTDGGIGILTDYNGHDVYNSDFFSQGGSYWYSLGILHDRKGCDRYTAGQYSQGSGIHLSFGALLDDEGNDMYDAYAGLEQGNAHDWSAGCLEDLEGDDTYRGYTSSQGSALTVAFAYLYDKQGNDMYIINKNDTTYSQGGGRQQPTRKAVSLGILLDKGNGSDTYTDPRIFEGIPLLKGQRGIVFDDGIKK
ncbi:MAG: hypothetical protein EPN82_04270 [Bacteroidetes bacterium]|nr:MAG: hypothetical protein EPN82_04270 [Bacteroidota bacterium]